MVVDRNNFDAYRVKQWKECGERFASWNPTAGGHFKVTQLVEMERVLTREELAQIVEWRDQGMPKSRIAASLEIPYDLVCRMIKMDPAKWGRTNDLPASDRYGVMQRRLLNELEKRTSTSAKLGKLGIEELLGYLKHCTESVAKMREAESFGAEKKFEVISSMPFDEDLTKQ